MSDSTSHVLRTQEDLYQHLRHLPVRPIADWGEEGHCAYGALESDLANYIGEDYHFDTAREARDSMVRYLRALQQAAAAYERALGAVRVE